MKKKFCYVLIGLIVSLTFVNSVFSVEGLEFGFGAKASSTTVVKGETAEVTINLRSGVAIHHCEFSYKTDSTIAFASKEELNTWRFSTGDDKVIIENNNIDPPVASPNGINVAKFKFVVNGNGSVTFSNIKCYSVEKLGFNNKGEAEEMSGTYQDVRVSFTSKDPADDTSLKKLVVTGGQLAPAFKSDVYDNYVIQLSSPNFSLSMEANFADYQDKIVVTDASGKTLDASNLVFSDASGQGMMPIKVTVNDATTYNLFAVYEKKDLDNSLSSLKINGQTITLEADKLEYKLEVGSDVSEILVEAVVKDSQNFQISSESNIGTDGKGTVSLPDVAHVIIVVEPKSEQIGGKIKTYLVEVVKKGATPPSGETPKPENPTPTPPSSGNVDKNVETGDIPMFMMAFILIVSLIGSVVLYQRNMESYK